MFLSMMLLPTIDGAMEEHYRESNLRIGSGFRLSELGMKRCRRFKNRTGVIVGVNPTGSSFRVIMKGRKQPITLHESYLEPDSDYVKPMRF
jgi:hypothetical protein